LNQRLKSLLFIALMLIGAATRAEGVSVVFRCMVSTGDKPVRLEWRTFSEPATRWTSGYVRYQGAKSVAPLIFRSSEVKPASADLPAQVRSVWLEVIAGQFTGEYIAVLQGASLYSFVYKNYHSGKEIAFLQDDAPHQESGCVWRAF
jgi:hypothetical protein